MKKAIIPTLLLAFAGLNACGTDDTGASADAGSKLAASQVIHRIQPLNVTSTCFGSYEQVIRDHRFTPPRTYSKYVLGMKACSPPASSLVIQMLGGEQWVGGYSFVTIKKNGLCLTNPVENVAGTDKGEAIWQGCVAQNSNSPERFRQQWLLSFNRYNAMQIQTQAAIRLGFPNAQAQCLDAQSPTEIKRVACTLNNWQVQQMN